MLACRRVVPLQTLALRESHVDESRPAVRRGGDGIDSEQLHRIDAVGQYVAGSTGIGKSFIGAALAHAACRANYCVRCFRLPRLIDELSRAHAFQRRSTFLRTLAKADLLLIDDFAIGPLSDQSKRDLLEILDDRYDKSATIITSQLDVKHWHAYLDDPTLADAILDRVVHNAYHLDLSGESIRKLKSIRARNAKNGGAHTTGSIEIAAPGAL